MHSNMQDETLGGPEACRQTEEAVPSPALISLQDSGGKSLTQLS